MRCLFNGDGGLVGVRGGFRYVRGGGEGSSMEVWLEVCLSQECRTEIASESVQLHEASGWEKVVTFALLLKRR